MTDINILDDMKMSKRNEKEKDDQKDKKALFEIDSSDKNDQSNDYSFVDYAFASSAFANLALMIS